MNNNIGSFDRNKFSYTLLVKFLLILIVSCLGYKPNAGFADDFVELDNGDFYAGCEYDISSDDFNFSSNKDTYNKIKNFISFDVRSSSHLFTKYKTGENYKNASDICLKKYVDNNCKDVCLKEKNDCISKCNNDNDCVNNCTENSCEGKCYGNDHICKTYLNKNDAYYLAVQGTKIDGSNNDSSEYFYIFRKNVKALGEDELPSNNAVYNCILKKYSCDFNPGYNEYVVDGKTYYNVIIEGSNDTEFNKIINSKVGKNFEFFKIEGKCNNYKDCKDKNNNNVMEVKYYFKKLFNDGKVEYYVKNVNFNLCNNYLPSCDSVVNGEKTSVFSKDYKNRNRYYESNGFFNSSNNNVVFEENLQVLGDKSSSSGKVCLQSDRENKNKSYCSDIIVTYDSKNKNLKKRVKYEDGIKHTNTKGKNIAYLPNCFMKSCIDLTAEEIRVNEEYNEKYNKNRKYCSEFRWLRNDSKLKYFPKEKPIYCSDIDSSGNRLKFLSNGGGINKNKDNCYLKRCISLTDKERKLVAKQNMLNIDKIIKDQSDEKFTLNIDNVRDRMPKFCDNQIFLVSDEIIEDNNAENNIISKSKFDNIKLNILPCYDFSSDTYNLIKGNSINFKDIFFKGSYDIGSNNKLCREAIRPIYNENIIDERSASFLCSVFVTKDEAELAKSKGYSENNGNPITNANYTDLCDNPYGKISIDRVSYSTEGNKHVNIVKSVDNTLAFLNADIVDIENGVREVCKTDKNGNYIIDDEGRCKVEEKKFEAIKMFVPDNILRVYQGSEVKVLGEKDESIEKLSNDYYNCLKKNGYDHEKCKNEEKEYNEKNKKSVFHVYDYFVNFNDYRPNASYEQRIGTDDKSYFDCNLYRGSTFISDNYKDLKNSILLACDSEFKPEEDERDIVTVPDKYSMILSSRPVIDNGGFENNETDLSFLDKNINGIFFDVPRNASAYGCYYINIQGNNEKFCKITTDDSLYINNFNTINNGIASPSQISANLSVCLRHTDDPRKEDFHEKCGQRRSGKYKDKCLELNIASLDAKNTLNFDTNYNINGKAGDLRTYIHADDAGKFYSKNYSEALNSNYFRTDRYGRNIYTFYDFLTNYNCLAENRKLTDGVTAATITAECFLMSKACLMFDAVCFAVCTGIRIPKEALFSLDNDMYYMRDYSSFFDDKPDLYNKDGIGFYSNVNITDNNNILYNYYRRSDELFKDLKYRFALGSSYYGDDNVLARNIIKECGLKKIIKYEKNDNSITYEINSKGIKCNGDDINDCLSDEQKECLKSFGVHFFSNGMKLKDIEGKTFLKEYKDGYYTKSMYNNKSDGYGILPVNIARYASNGIDNSSNADCKLNEFGSPIGDLTRCRGYYYKVGEDRFFVKESQAAKLALQTSPQLFFNLANPKNTPDLFSPHLSLIGYYDYNGREKSYEGENFLLDFFEPRLEFKYDFPGTNGNLGNSVTNECGFENNINDSCKTIKVKIDSDKNKSDVKKLTYTIKGSTYEQEYYFVLSKESILDGSKVETPKVCLHQLTKVDSGVLDDNICYTKDTSNCWVIKNKNVFCYDRKYPAVGDIKMKVSKDFSYKKPYINVSLSNSSSAPNFGNSSYYYNNLGNSDIGEKNVDLNGKNDVQNSIIKFRRSECSKSEIDYYQYEYLLNHDSSNLREKSNYRKNISLIEQNIMKDCDIQNGNPYYVIDVDEDGYVKEKFKVKSDYSTYGGFNEVCLSNEYVDKIKKDLNHSRIVAYTYKNGVDGKCFLSKLSRTKSECLVSKKVYAVCDDNDIVCKDYKTDSLTGKKVRVREIDCSSLLKNDKSLKDLSEKEIFEMKACYKGGYNPYGNIYTIDGSKDYSCDCETEDNVGDIPEELKKYFEFREPTARELSLCLNLIDAPKCEAVKYYGSDRIYYDNGIGVREAEFDSNGLCYPNMSCRSTDGANASQHLWRSNEKLFGVIKPFSKNVKTLGHAEFDSTLYCLDDNGKETDLCTSGKKEVKGMCNGFWRNKSNGNGVTAVCQKDGKGGYEYKLVDNEECVRYQCQGVFYSDGKIYSDESDIISSDAVGLIGFDNIESKMYDGIKVNNYRTFIHREDSDSASVDKRGSKHGFAVWEDTESKDVVVMKTARSCLTGFGATASNYLREYSNDFNYIEKGSNKINYDVLAESSEAGKNERKKLVEVLKKQIEIFNRIQNDRLPKRYCDQLGNWLSVRDIYSNSDTVNDDLFFYSNNEKWNNTLLKSRNEIEDGVVDFVSRISTTSDGVFGRVSNDAEFVKGYISFNDKNRYCERLFCPSISIDKYAATDGLLYNIYDYELGNKSYTSNNEDIKEVNISDYTTWRHTGGASWDSISAPRNDTSKINSKDIENIFSKQDDDNISLSSMKYLKKVEGKCQTEYGYYERGTKFVNSYSEQYKTILSNNTQSDKEVNPRNFEFTVAKNDNITKPMRVCSSVGLWSGVANSCFRSCEMLDMYHTKLDGNIDNNNSEITVKNSDIKAVYVGITNKDKEDRFKQSSDKDSKGYIYGDYLTGGAKWARTIVSLEPSKVKEENGLRYIEVEGECDTSYDSENKTTQYVVNSNGKRPRRRCYEDGTWGPVIGDTRCVTFKTCSELDMTPENLADIIKMYKNNKSPKEISEELNKIARSETIGDNIMKFSASEYNSSTLTSINRVRVDCSLEKDYGNSFLTCNLTNESSDFNNGWLTESDIGENFVPSFCYSGTKYENKANNRLKVKKIPSGVKMYSKESKLDEVYNKLNSDEDKNFNGTTINNALNKDVDIGSKMYSSYQNSTQCDSNLFYNKYLDNYNNEKNKDKKNKYNDSYKVLYECHNDGSMPYISFTDDGGKDDGVGPSIISPYNCRVRMCGGRGSLQENWGKYDVDGTDKALSVGIYDVASNSGDYGYDSNHVYLNDVSSSKTHQTLRCPKGYAFVFEGQIDERQKNLTTKDRTKVLEYYTSDNVEETISINRGWVSAINADCVGNDSFVEVNGEKREDAYKYGNISSELIDDSRNRINLCRDIKKMNCSSISLKDTFSDDFLNDSADKEKPGFCVYMGCRFDGLNIEGGTNPYKGIKEFSFNKEYSIGSEFNGTNDLCNGKACDVNYSLCISGDQYTSGKENPVTFIDYLYKNDNYLFCSSYIKDIQYNGSDNEIVSTSDLFDFAGKLSKIPYSTISENDEIRNAFKKDVVLYVLNNGNEEFIKLVKEKYKDEIKTKLSDNIEDYNDDVKKCFFDNNSSLTLLEEDKYNDYTSLDYKIYNNNDDSELYVNLLEECSEECNKEECNNSDNSTDSTNNSVTSSTECFGDSCADDNTNISRSGEECNGSECNNNTNACKPETCTGYNYMTFDNFKNIYNSVVGDIINEVSNSVKTLDFKKIRFDDMKKIYNGLKNCYGIEYVYDKYNDENSYDEDGQAKNDVISHIRNFDSNGGNCNYDTDYEYYRKLYTMGKFLQSDDEHTKNYKELLENTQKYLNQFNLGSSNHNVFMNNSLLYICSDMYKYNGTDNHYRCVLNNLDKVSQSVKCIKLEDDKISEENCTILKNEDEEVEKIDTVGMKDFIGNIYIDFLNEKNNESYLKRIKNFYEKDIIGICKKELVEGYKKAYNDQKRNNDSKNYNTGFYAIFKCEFDGSIKQLTETQCKNRCSGFEPRYTHHGCSGSKKCDPKSSVTVIGDIIREGRHNDKALRLLGKHKNINVGCGRTDDSFLVIVDAKCDNGKWVRNGTTECNSKVYGTYATNYANPWEWFDKVKRSDKKCGYEYLYNNGSNIGCGVCCDN